MRIVVDTNIAFSAILNKTISLITSDELSNENNKGLIS